MYRIIKKDGFETIDPKTNLSPAGAERKTQKRRWEENDLSKQSARYRAYSRKPIQTN